jgi:hypothetical protein
VATLIEAEAAKLTSGTTVFALVEGAGYRPEEKAGDIIMTVHPLTHSCETDAIFKSLADF